MNKSFFIVSNQYRHFNVARQELDPHTESRRTCQVRISPLVVQTFKKFPIRTCKNILCHISLVLSPTLRFNLDGDSQNTYCPTWEKHGRGHCHCGFFSSPRPLSPHQPHFCGIYSSPCFADETVRRGNFKAREKFHPIQIYTFYLPLRRADRDWTSSSSCVPSEQKNVKTNIWRQVVKHNHLFNLWRLTWNKREKEKVTI